MAAVRDVYLAMNGVIVFFTFLLYLGAYSWLFSVVHGKF
jgi:hypothetical protein